MRTIKKTVLLTLIASASLIFSCAKDGKDGPVGPAGVSGPKGDAGPQAKTFNFNLTFNAGDTYKS